MPTDSPPLEAVVAVCRDREAGGWSGLCPGILGLGFSPVPGLQ